MQRVLAILPALALTITGCSALAEDTSDQTAGVPQIAAAFYPLQYVAERVAGDGAEVTGLTQPGTEPHDLELTIRETAMISEADLVIHELDFQPAVDDSVEQNATGEVLDAAAVTDLLPFEEGEEGHSDEEAAVEDEESHDEEEHSDEEGDEHEHGEFDPHFWHDPMRLADLADAVAEKLSEIDPDATEGYQDNAAGLREELEALDQEFVDGLSSCERDTIVVSHDAFGYLGKYGLELAPIAGLSPDAEPTPADLGNLQKLIVDTGITTVFSERLASPAFSQALADDLDLAVAVLDPLEGLTDETEGEDYFSLMRDNLGEIRQANACV